MDPTARLNEAAEAVRAALDSVDNARETAYRLQREVTRAAASSIRAVHQRHDDEAAEWLAAAREQCAAMNRAARAAPAVHSTGFVTDAQKEYAEAALLVALIHGTTPPSPDDLDIEPACWLNGLAEAATELRRFILDALNQKDFARAEQTLAWFDQIYGLLVTFDYPEAVTYGLKRRLDVVRGSLERTTSDVMITIREANLQDAVERLERLLAERG